MAIEIIAQGDNAYDEPNGDATTTTTEGQDTGTEEGAVVEETAGVVSDDKQSATEDAATTESGDADATTGEGEESTDDTGADTSDFYFNGAPVEVTIPDDIRKELADNGIDVSEVVKELYSKDGDFTLSGATYTKMCEAFGKFSVDTYISSLKLQNETFMQNATREQEAQAKADEKRYGEVLEMVGGEEAWEALGAFAVESLSDAELGQVNEIMSSGNSFAQNLVIMDLQNRMKTQKGDDKVSLLDATPDVNLDVQDAPLDRAEYQRLTSELASKFKFDPDGYAREQSKLDARRRAALNR